MEKIIVASNVTKRFKLSKKQQKINQTNKSVITAVNNLSFSVNKGRIYGLLGSNGAGKTTMLRMISTLIKPNEGEIKVLGYDVVKDAMIVRDEIAFLTSELRLEDFFTPSYLFTFYSRLHDVDEDLIEERKKYLFNIFEIGSFSEVKVGDLSTGMKQKVSLAISLAHMPEVIIFDEPTNGLDVLTAKVVTNFLLDLKEEGKTIILSTHIFSLVEDLCDDVGIIVDGKMVLEGTLEEVTKEKRLEDVFFDVYKENVGEELWKQFGQ